MYLFFIILQYSAMELEIKNVNKSVAALKKDIQKVLKMQLIILTMFNLNIGFFKTRLLIQ